MTNKEAIKILSEMPISTMSDMSFETIFDALNLAIEALKNERPRFRHVTLNHPRFGKCDACYDEKRMLFYTDPITAEILIKYNWTWEEAENDK